MLDSEQSAVLPLGSLPGCFGELAIAVHACHASCRCADEWWAGPTPNVTSKHPTSLCVALGLGHVSNVGVFSVLGARQLTAAEAGRDRGSHTCVADQHCVAAGCARTATLQQPARAGWNAPQGPMLSHPLPKALPLSLLFTAATSVSAMASSLFAPLGTSQWAR